MLAGAVVVDVTPEVGGPMSGYVARTSTSTGVHDPITVRALCVDDTAVVAVDVAGLHEDFCAAVAAAVSLPAANVRVHATHTHGGPASMPGRFGGEIDLVWLQQVQQACIDAVEQASADQRPVNLLAGYGPEVDVARNRRRPDGPVDHTLPVARFVDLAGRTVAVLTSYACHPVVLGADNTLLTADYPGVVRRLIEAHYPGSVAIFMTGCAGDANTGHAASASVALQATPNRTFAAAETTGRTIAEAVLSAQLAPYDGPVRSAVGHVDLAFTTDHLIDVPTWQTTVAAPETDPATAALLRCWITWATNRSTTATWRAQVGVLTWGGVRILTLPGEPFAQTGLDFRAAANAAVTFVPGYTDGCPGYFPPPDEHPRGGYEVLEAHRYYNLPAPFAPDSTTRLTSTLHPLLPTDG